MNLLISHIRKVLTDAQNSEPGKWPTQGDCKEAITEVKLEIKAWIKGGVVSSIVELADVKQKGNYKYYINEYSNSFHFKYSTTLLLLFRVKDPPLTLEKETKKKLAIYTKIL